MQLYFGYVFLSRILDGLFFDKKSGISSKFLSECISIMCYGLLPVCLELE